MPHDVIMPALGMTQDSGLIVAWHKQAGDAVKSDDILMEVETDKATMEVEAGHNGFLVELRAEAGSDVPVGQVVAVVSETNEQPDSEAVPPAEIKIPVPNTPEATKAEASPSDSLTSQRPLASSRILASPKAKRLARERDIDLQCLVDQGLPQPYHAADLDKLLPEAIPVRTSVQSVQCQISARAAAEPLLKLRERLSNEIESAIPMAAIWAAFAAGSLRPEMSLPTGAALVVQVESLMTESNSFIVADPDHTGLVKASETNCDLTPCLLIRDLSDSPLTVFRDDVEAGLPILTLVKPTGCGEYELSLDFPSRSLTSQQAASALISLVGRIENPLLHLL